MGILVQLAAGLLFGIGLVVSGMANRKRSVATRCEPCTESPTPPPMSMPSMNEIHGLA